MADEPKLIVGLEARLDKFEKDLRQAGMIAEREVAQIERAFTSRDFLSGIAQGIGQQLPAAIANFVKQIPAMLDEVAKIGDLSEVIGLTTDEIQTMRFALEQSGGTAAQADAAMRKFADTVVDAGRGAGQLAKWFEANNVAVKNADGSMRSMNALLAEMARLIQGARSPQEALNLATDAFGRSAAPAMVRALKDGAAGLADFNKEAREAGIILDKNLIAQARILDDEFTKLTSSASSLAKSFTVLAASEFRDVLKGMAEQSRTTKVDLLGLAQVMVDFGKAVPGFGFAFKQELEELDAAIKKNLGTLQTAKDALGFAPRAAREGESPAAAEAATRITVTPGAKEVAEKKSAVDRLNESMSRSLELSKAELATVGLTIEQRERARADALLTEAMKRDGLTLETAITQEIRRQAAEQAHMKQLLAERQAQVQALASMSQEFGSMMSDAMKGMVLQGQKFNEVLKNMAARISSKAFDKLFDLFFATPAGGGSSLFAGLFGGGRAGGGAVSAGTPYLVGERGPELFVPGKSGMVVPNTALARGTGGNTVITGAPTAVTIQGSADRSTVELMRQMFETRDRRFIADVARATVELRRRSAFA